MALKSQKYCCIASSSDASTGLIPAVVSFSSFLQASFTIVMYGSLECAEKIINNN